MDFKKQFATVPEAAERWRQCEETVRRLLRSRRVASIVIGRRRLIPIGEIERIEKEGTVYAKK
jgi:hypothetical protein